MNIFDIIGPVMVGPSSSHTAGAARIGRVTRALLGERPVFADILLHGSFAGTGQGHGTDKALVAGLLDFMPDDLRIRDSLRLAEEAGLKLQFGEVSLKDAHPNTALLQVRGESGAEVEVLAASVGGGNISVRRINGLEVDFSGQYPTLILPHEDVPGTIAAVTGVLAGEGINVASMRVFRNHRGGDAMMVIETDQQATSGTLSKLRGQPHVQGVTALAPL